jgi:hypothetical protein
MKLPSLPITAFTISILFVSSSPVLARPVTTADLSGKMICWSNGVIQSFEADGKSASSQYADGAWSIGGNGVRSEFPGGGGAIVDMEIQPDGTFTFEVTNGGETQKGTAKICKTKPLHYADLVGKKLCLQFGNVLSFSSDGKAIDSVEGEGNVYPEDASSNFEWKLKKYDKVFKGKEQQLEDGRVVYVGSRPGADYGLHAGEFCK